MTAATPPVSTSPISSRNASYLFMRRLHSATGLIFSGYIVVHLLINATLLQGTKPDVFQEQVDKIHSLPFLIGVEWLLIYLPIIYHTLYGIWIAITGRPNVGDYGYKKNWFYTLQRISSVVLVAFIAFHILAMKGVFGGALGTSLTFVPHAHARQSTINHIHAAWWVTYLVYPIGLLAGTYHLSNGLWTAAITWGVTITKVAQRRWGYACTGLFVFTTACAFGAWGAALAGTPRPLPQQAEYVDPNKTALPTPSDVIIGADNAVTGDDKPLPSK